MKYTIEQLRGFCNQGYFGSVNPTLIIDSFSAEFDFLSNFYPCRIEFEGEVYGSVEHAFQAGKSPDRAYRRRVRELSAARAKQLGRQIKIPSDWGIRRLPLMLSLLKQKFEFKSDLEELLDATYPAILIEGNSWKDTFWGVCNGKGENHLGKLLMQIREDILPF